LHAIQITKLKAIRSCGIKWYIESLLSHWLLEHVITIIIIIIF